MKEARRLNAFCVRGNHDDSALAAYHAKQRGEHVDVRSQLLLVGLRSSSPPRTSR